MESAYIDARLFMLDVRGKRKEDLLVGLEDNDVDYETLGCDSASVAVTFPIKAVTRHVSAGYTAVCTPSRMATLLITMRKFLGYAYHTYPSRANPIPFSIPLRTCET